MEVAASGQQQVRRARRLSLSLLLSLLAHALLLSLTFSAQESGLPGFAFPWQERRILVQAPDLRVELVPPPVAIPNPADAPAPPPLPPAVVERPAPADRAIVTFRSPEQRPAQTAARATVPRSTSTAKAGPKPRKATGTASATAPARLAPTPKSFPAVIALEQSAETEIVVPPAPPEAAPAVPADSGDAGVAAQSRIEQAAPERVAEDAARADAEQHEAARQEAARREEARQEVVRAEAARQENARLEQARQEATQQEAVRAESARLEAERQESARQAAARQEQAQQEAARQEAARAESARLEAERQESARQAAARQEQARQEAARQEAVRAESARLEAERQENARQAAARQEQEARRDAIRRAMGRQLDEEAARREAAQAARPSPSASGLRRARVFGRTDPNAEIIRYVEAWSQKIHFNMTFDKVRELVKQPHSDPVVTVAIRSDGSVESVTFVRSSGVPAIDEAIRRIVYSQTPYLPFQPALARDVDVIEIRRTWHFDTAIRLY